jgi:hypothetical protein
MPANTSPIFPLVPRITWVNAAGLVANTTTDLTAGTIYNSGFTAGANGSRIDYIRFRSLGTSTQSVARIWLNNGSSTATAANNTLIYEYTIYPYTLTQTQNSGDILAQLNLSIPAGYVIYYTFGTAVGGSGLDVSVVAGDY